MQKRWVQRSQGDQQQIESLAHRLNIDRALSQVLVSRNICTYEDAKSYFRPQLTDFHDPFLMKDMEKAVSRIQQAIQGSEKILVYGDYDVDGTTAVAAVFSYLKTFTSFVEYYIPDRHKEGYGISETGINYASDNQFSLIIALDCGIKSIDNVEYSTRLGIDFIICDHHLPGEEIPSAVAVLDPKRLDCTYPFKELSGCGIGLKLIQALGITSDREQGEYTRYLDLAMVSTAADIVSMAGENRVIAWHGLKKLNTNPCAGLSALIQISGRPLPFSISDVVFQLAPRINSTGRMGHAKQAVSMLLCDENDTATDQSILINVHNVDRKLSDQQITAEALAIIQSDPNLQNKKTTVVFGAQWNKGVIGIVASRLIETYYRPTVVLTESNGKITGSARSVAGFDLYAALVQCSDHLIQFGGHQYAAGLTLEPGALADFSAQFEKIVSESIEPELLIPTLVFDATIKLSQIDAKFYRIIAQMAPFGPENMMPVFRSDSVRLTGNASIVGENHLKFSIMQDNSAVFECIAFGQADLLEKLRTCSVFSVCYTIEENQWRDRRTLQLNVKDISLNGLQTAGKPNVYDVVL